MLDILLSIVFAMLPVIVWGYLFSYAENSHFSGLRFLFGIIAGAAGVLPIAYSSNVAEYFGTESMFAFISEKTPHFSDISSALAVSYLLPIAIVITVGLVLSSSAFSKFYKYVLFALSAIVAYGVAYAASLYVGNPIDNASGMQFSLVGHALRGFLAIGFAYAFVAGVEEAVKHFALYPLLADNDDRQKIALASAFGALGFVFLENTLYLSNIASVQGILSDSFISTFLSRSIVSLLLHVFAALLVAFGFARLFEGKKFAIVGAFFGYFLAAVFVHAGFDIALTYGKTGIIALYAFVGYFFFTKAFFDERGA